MATDILIDLSTQTLQRLGHVMVPSSRDGLHHSKEDLDKSLCLVFSVITRAERALVFSSLLCNSSARSAGILLNFVLIQPRTSCLKLSSFCNLAIIMN